MTRTAYLILAFDITSGLPRFASAGIYSESAETLSVLTPSVMMVEAITASAPTYEEAAALIDQEVRSQPQTRWLFGPKMTEGPHQAAFCRVPVPDADEIKAITVLNVKTAVANCFGVSVPQLMGGDRHKNVAIARHVAMYMARKHLGLSYPEAAAAFGLKDHTTAMAAEKKVVKLAKENEALARRLRMVERALGVLEG